MSKPSVRFIIILSIILLILGFISFIAPTLVTHIYAISRTATVENALNERVVIVFGAGLWHDGTPTPVLESRITQAAELYFSGKVEKLLMSGDNRVLDYNEPGAMRSYAVDLGVPYEDIVLDFAGRRTYDTCYRARDIFGLSKAILVTQPFHLPRAIYTCNKLGVDAIGVSASEYIYLKSKLLFWYLREIPATFMALWEIHLSHPTPVLGEPEPIFPRQTKVVD